MRSTPEPNTKPDELDTLYRELLVRVHPDRVASADARDVADALFRQLRQLYQDQDIESLRMWREECQQADVADSTERVLMNRIHLRMRLRMVQKELDRQNACLVYRYFADDDGGLRRLLSD